eukprot:CAMPEP_0198666834 /NCGR_PEP_ID=MMETSP1467-20131203/66253_1 /TAXON_ID=1462469 /ORGANISM="unid. sp., Strain CCMP2135" /LENGTH=322 /DNA_ID=CAMNT_0044403501 /DNA_START=46 /DNA_END=1011 /DNA_ORIENTATION=+
MTTVARRCDELVGSLPIMSSATATATPPPRVRVRRRRTEEEATAVEQQRITQRSNDDDGSDRKKKGGQQALLEEKNERLPSSSVLERGVLEVLGAVVGADLAATLGHESSLLGGFVVQVPAEAGFDDDGAEDDGAEELGEAGADLGPRGGGHDGDPPHEVTECHAAGGHTTVVRVQNHRQADAQTDRGHVRQNNVEHELDEPIEFGLRERERKGGAGRDVKTQNDGLHLRIQRALFPEQHHRLQLRQRPLVRRAHVPRPLLVLAAVRAAALAQRRVHAIQEVIVNKHHPAAVLAAAADRTLLEARTHPLAPPSPDGYERSKA